MKRGKIVFDVSNDSFLSIASSVETGTQFPPIIVLEREQGREIVEGYARATGYSLVANPSKPLLALIGTLVHKSQAHFEEK